MSSSAYQVEPIGYVSTTGRYALVIDKAYRPALTELEARLRWSPHPRFSLEMAAMFWFGPKLVTAGILVAGITAFLPTLLVRWIPRRTRAVRQPPIIADVATGQVEDERR